MHLIKLTLYYNIVVSSQQARRPLFFFLWKWLSVSTQNRKVSFPHVFQGREIIIIMKRHDFIAKGNYTYNPSKAEDPDCITADICPGQNKLLLHSRWFVGSLGIVFLYKKKLGIFILKGYEIDWGIVLTNWLVIFLRINVPPSYNCTWKCFITSCKCWGGRVGW